MELTAISGTGLYLMECNEIGRVLHFDAQLLAQQVYVGGHFASRTATFGSQLLTNTSSLGLTADRPDNPVNAGMPDVYLARLDEAGTTQWAWGRTMGGLGRDKAGALVSDGQSVYVAGQSSSPTLSIGATQLTNPSPAIIFHVGYEYFVARVSLAGTFAETQHIRGTGDAWAPAAAVVGGAGSCDGIADFGSQSVVSMLSSTTGFIATTLTIPLAARAAVQPGLALFPNPTTGRAKL